jgi:hypothetical protein
MAVARPVDGFWDRGHSCRKTERPELSCGRSWIGKFSVGCKRCGGQCRSNSGLLGVLSGLAGQIHSVKRVGA